MKKTTFKNLFKLVPDKKARYFQTIPEVRKAEAADVEEVDASAVSTLHEDPSSQDPNKGPSLLPDLTVIYQDEHRDMVISKEYTTALIRPFPLFCVSIAFSTSSNTDDAAMTPITLHYGADKAGPVYGYVNAIERHTKGTILNHAYNPSAPFANTVVHIDAHITKCYCDFSFSTPSPSDNITPVLKSFKWKQSKASPEVMALARERAVEGHDWCWVERGYKSGMILFDVSNGESSAEKLAVYVPAKNHSKMNPVKIAAKVRWFESATWTQELKLAALLALLTYAEKGRRGGSRSGAAA